MDGRGDDVITALAPVDMIVRMHRSVSQLSSQQLGCSVRNHFVGIHVRRSARAGLEDVHHELRVELPISHLLRGLLNGRGQARVQQPQLRVRGRSVLLDQARGADERTGEAQAADWKVFDSPRRLRAVIGVRRHAHLAHRIRFAAKLRLHGAKPGQNVVQPCANGECSPGCGPKRAIPTILACTWLSPPNRLPSRCFTPRKPPVNPLYTAEWRRAVASRPPLRTVLESFPSYGSSQSDRCTYCEHAAAIERRIECVQVPHRAVGTGAAFPPPQRTRQTKWWRFSKYSV